MLEGDMSEQWEPIPISEVESGQKIETAGLTPAGLSTNPGILHDRHLHSANHLAEVQEMHTRLLVSAGELPETHMAEIAPERRLAWVIEEMGGKLSPSGASIPLRGTSLGRIELSRGELHGHPALKLNLLDVDMVRTIPLPDEADLVSATWSAGELQLHW